MIQFTITIQKDNLGGTGVAFALNAKTVDKIERDLLAQYLSEQAMAIAEDVNNGQLKRVKSVDLAV